MRYLVPALSILATVVSAQSTGCNTNCITIPTGGITVRAGGTYNLQWSNPSNGQVIIKLQTSPDITPTSGITLAPSVDARTGSYVVTIPANVPNTGYYVFEIIDAANPSIYNFSNPVTVTGATAAATTASSTGSSASSSSRATGSSTVTSGSSSSATAMSTSTGSSSGTQTSSMSSSRTSSSSAAASSTAAPSSGASSLKIEGAALAIIAAVAGLL